MAYFNEENTVEQMLISVAQKCGWTYVEAKDIPRATDSVLVESWLQDALIRLNKITAAQASQVIYKLRAAIMSGSAPDELIQANDRFRKLLFEENSEPFGKNGDNLNIRFFSENPSENYCVVTNQWEFPRQSIDGGKRLDLVFRGQDSCSPTSYLGRWRKRPYGIPKEYSRDVCVECIGILIRGQRAAIWRHRSAC